MDRPFSTPVNDALVSRSWKSIYPDPILSIRNALSVIISLGPDRPQSTTSTVPRGEPGGFHQ